MPASHCRLGRIRLKAGGAEVRVLQPSAEHVDGGRLMARIRRVLEVHQGAVAGFAFVVWDGAGASTCTTVVGQASRIPSILVGDFVRNRLLADIIEHWVQEDLREGG